MVYQRPSTYKERREDGYQEPQLIFILGTAHVSQQSADDVTRLIAAVQPDAVVVELCKSRTGVLHVQQDTTQQQEVSLQQQQQQARQQRWQQQWQDWQQRRLQQQGGEVPAASSSASSSLEEDAPSTSSPSSTVLTTSSSSSSNDGMWSQWQSFLRRSQSAKASNPLSLSGPDPLTAMARSASLGGQQAMLLRLLIAGQARKAAGGGGIPTAASREGAFYDRMKLQWESAGGWWMVQSSCLPSEPVQGCSPCCLDWGRVHNVGLEGDGLYAVWEQ